MVFLGNKLGRVEGWRGSMNCSQPLQISKETGNGLLGWINARHGQMPSSSGLSRLYRVLADFALQALFSDPSSSKSKVRKYGVQVSVTGVNFQAAQLPVEAPLIPSPRLTRWLALFEPLITANIRYHEAMALRSERSGRVGGVLADMAINTVKYMYTNTVQTESQSVSVYPHYFSST